MNVAPVEIDGLTGIDAQAVDSLTSVLFPTSFRTTWGIFPASRNAHITISTSSPSSSSCNFNIKNTKVSGFSNVGNFYALIIGRYA